MAVCVSVLARRQSLMVRLRVWHRSEHRRDYTNNQYLAHILSSSDLYGWNAEPAELDSENSSGEDFVPIEANLHWRGDNLLVAEGTFRAVFAKTVKLHIPEMFKRRQGKPLYVTIYPIGDDIPDDSHTRFTHFELLQSLEVQSRAYARSCSTTERDFVVKRICMILDVPLECLELVMIFLQVRFGDVPCVEDIGKCIKLIKSEKENGVLSETAYLKWLEGFGEQRSVADGIAAKGVEALWSASLTSFWHVQLLSNQVQGCIESLSKGQAISDQDLLDNLVLMQRAVIHYSQYQSHIEKLTVPLLKMHGSDPYLVDSKASILVGTAVLSFLPGFGPLSAFFCSAGSMKLTACYQRLQKRRTVQDLGNAMQDFGKYLQEAQVALAAKFCNQIFKVRLESLSIAARNGTLKRLGVDVDHLHVQQFGDHQIVKTLELFHESYQSLKIKRDKVRDDAGLKEFTRIEPIEDEAEE